MQTSSISNTAIAKYSTLIIMGLTAAGFAGNYFNLPLFLNIDFLFGSIFAMLVLQFFGLGRGILSAAIISSYTFFLWNHPYAIIVMTAEVGVVGWLTEHYKGRFVLVDMLYWLIIGMPFVYLSHHIIMHVPPSNTYIVMIKQAVNGITNALVARLIFIGCTRSRSSLISFSEIMSNLLAFFVLFPVLIILALGSRSDFAETDRRIRTFLIEDSQLIGEYLNDWASHKESAITGLAEMAASNSPDQMQPYLQLIKQSNNNFLRIGLLDREATITAYSPLLDEHGQKNIGKNFADRPFIPILKQTLKPMLSEVVMGRIGTPKPMVTMLAPVVVKGEYAGYVTGIISLEQIQRHLDKAVDKEAMAYTIVDRNGNIIMTNRTDQKVMAPFTRGNGTINPLNAGINQWVPVLPANVSIIERWKNSYYFAETVIGKLAEWKLILEQPVAPFQKTLYDKFTDKLVLLFVILLGTLVLAELLTHRSVVTLVKLSLVTYDLPAKLAKGGREITWPTSGIKEINYMISNFREMANSLMERFKDIQEINESLELRVNDRTVELRESEERYQSILNASPDDITISDMEGRILMVSPAGVTMFGYDTEDEGIGLLITDFIAPEDRDRALSNFALKVQGILSGPDEYRGLRADGSTFDIEVKSDFIRGAEGQPTRVVFIVRDITERKNMQAQLIQAQKMEAIGTLAGGIAHDFNNILGAILGYTEMARDVCPHDSAAVSDLNQVLLACNRAKDLVKQILAFSRQTETEKIYLQPAKVGWETIKLLRSTLPTTIDITHNLDPEAGLLLVDPIHIHQILMNLCTNAFHAMEKTGGTLSISMKIKPLTQMDLVGIPNILPGNFVELSVRDNGPGIEPEILEKIFHPYFTTKDTGKGTGMGLAIVHGIVKSYGGFITCHSQIGEGTVFSINLPIVEGQSASGDKQVGAELIPFGTERILLVDDEKILVEMTQSMLERMGYVVTTRTSSVEALYIFRNQPDAFDLVITDQTMPGMAGIDLAQEMLHIRPGLPVILCTGYSSQVSEEMVRSCGIKGFVMKPLARNDIATLIRKMLDERVLNAARISYK